MPLYEFECLNCGQPFEKLVRNAAAVAEVVCPDCGQSHVRKKLSIFAANVKGGQTTQASGAACAPGGT
jgi:putative FmdB family regulatory protein